MKLDRENPDLPRLSRITEAVREFERRIAARELLADHRECRDLLLNRRPDGQEELVFETVPPGLQYVGSKSAMLRRINPRWQNHACLNCDLFGSPRCRGGLMFLYWVARQTDRVPEDLLLEAVPESQNLFLPAWDRMERNLPDLLDALRTFFEANLQSVSSEGEGNYF